MSKGATSERAIFSKEFLWQNMVLIPILLFLSRFLPIVDENETYSRQDYRFFQLIFFTIASISIRLDLVNLTPMLLIHVSSTTMQILKCYTFSIQT